MAIGPARKDEVRESSYTDAVVDGLLQAARGHGEADPTGLAAAEACASQTGRGLAAAIITPNDIGLTPALMSMLGRELVLRGQLVCRINRVSTRPRRPAPRGQPRRQR